MCVLVLETNIGAILLPLKLGNNFSFFLRAQRQIGRSFKLKECFFGENATYLNQALMSFKPGGFLPGQPVQPVLMRWNVLMICRNKKRRFFSTQFLPQVPCGRRARYSFMDLGSTPWFPHLLHLYSMSLVYTGNCFVLWLIYMRSKD